ncbi:MAG: hypothetical protein KatS3mg024_1906 [Armatimonadota bacterium]|nr:MAG: hypothetical protein KatS3mg024_1906 [Armatimonadota bacterium]
MRKLLTVLAAMGVLSTMFVGAAVAQTDWTILIAVGHGGTFQTPSEFNGVRLQFGTKATATDDKDTIDGFAGYQSDPLLNKAKASWYRPGWVSDGLAGRDFKAPLQPGQVKVWTDLVVWADPNYSGSVIDVHFYTPQTSLAPNSIGGVPVRYRVDLAYAPAGYNGPTSWMLGPVPDEGTNRLIGTVTLPVIDGVKVGSPISGTGPLAATQVGGYRLNVVVPEPGSMLVLASGITGLMGLIARRRSA